MRRNDRQIYYSSGEASSIVVVVPRLLDEEKGEARMDGDKTGIREIINYRKGDCIRNSVAELQDRFQEKSKVSYHSRVSGSTGS